MKQYREYSVVMVCHGRLLLLAWLLPLLLLLLLLLFGV